MSTVELKTITNQHLLAAAITIGLTDVSGIIAVYLEENKDIEAVLSRLDGFAEARQHESNDTRSRWIKLRNAARYHAHEDNRGEIEDDKFGFKAEARESATAAFHANGFDLSWDR